MSPATESVSELATLAGQGFGDKDIKVTVGKWTWKTDAPWPPVEAVLGTPFWKSEAFAATRDKLKRPLPVLEFEVSGDFISLTFGKAGGSARQLGVTDEPLDEVLRPLLLWL